jgi:predicted nucleic acid-binding protein
MATILLDANVLVFLASPSSPRRGVCQTAVEKIIERGDRPALSPQVLYEFWCVATRPTAANGLGWPVSEAWHAIAGFRREFDILHDPPEVLDIWLDLVLACNLKGKRIHDAHLLATMKANAVSTLLTFNTSDFPATPGITILAPAF